MDTGLSGRVVLVTGASGGIGPAVVRAFAAEGAQVVAHYHTGAAAAAALAAELPGCVALRAGLTDEAQVERLFADAEDALGPVAVLVANAGFWPPEPAPLHRLSLDRWRATLDANLTSAFLCARAFF